MHILPIIHYGYPDTLEMDYYINGELVGVGIVDRGKTPSLPAIFIMTPAISTGDWAYSVFSKK
jgi:hypothetical protein